MLKVCHLCLAWTELAGDAAGQDGGVLAECVREACPVLVYIMPDTSQQCLLLTFMSTQKFKALYLVDVPSRGTQVGHSHSCGLGISKPALAPGY